MLHDPIRELRTKYEMLEEENRQLRDRIAKLTGQDQRAAVRHVFGFTETEAGIFVTLLTCGVCEYDTLKSAAYSDHALMTMENPEWALRAHMKRIRRQTRPFGIDFITLYGRGFEMSDGARERARSLLKRSGK